MRLCSIPGCKRKHNAHGFCMTHYRRWRIHGDPMRGRPAPRKKPDCKVEGCDKTAERLGFCQMHHYRWKHYGDPHRLKYERKLCIAKGCTRQSQRNREYCRLHRDRLQRNGTTEPIVRPKNKKRYLSQKQINHPLANRHGKVATHRAVLYDTSGGARWMPCFWCAKPVAWHLHRLDENALKVDHMDHDRHNNEPENLVPSCNRCNCARSRWRRHKPPLVSVYQATVAS